jgi:hypothetical protein
VKRGADPAPPEANGVLSRLAAYPVLVAAAYVLYIAITDEVAPPGFVRPLFWTLVLAGAITLTCAAIARSWPKGAAWGLLILLLVASREWLELLVALLNRTFGAGAVTVFASIVVAAVSLLAVAILLARRHRGHVLAPMTRALNIIAFALLGILAVSAMGQVPTWVATRAASATTADASLPNIYLILLDGYPRADVLREDFGVDNGDFRSSLEELGLSISDESHSNYTFTLLTLSSLFQGDYITLADPDGEALTQARVRTDFDEATLRGDAVLALRAVGYEIAASAEGFEHVSMRAAADYFMERPQLTDIDARLLRSTWLLDLPFVPRDWLIADQRSRISGIFDDAITFVGLERDHPVLALVHVPSPHAPVVFGQDGGPVPWGSRQFGAAFAEEYGVSQEVFLMVYGHQIDYLNERTLELVTHIRRTDPDAAVVVFSDHGTAPLPWSDPRTLLPNLMAAYFPDDPPSDEELNTPLRLMRAILRRYAGMDLPNLPDRYWVAGEENGLIVVEESTPLQ